MRRLTPFVLLGLFGCSGLLPSPSPAPRPREWGDPATLVQIDDSRLKESSGVAASRRQAGIYYTHNDSGDSARFFRFDTKGKILASFTLNSARNIDWEDMASVTLDGKSYLCLGDIGDNARQRKTITVYRVAEPTGGSTDIRDYETYTLTYPDQAHNAEAMMVDPRTGDIYVVTKTERERAQVFRARIASGKQYAKLEEVGKIKVGGALEATRLITGGDISPDGRYLVVRTYMAAYEWPLAELFKAEPTKIKTNLDLVGEAICYSRDGKALITTAEMRPCLVSRIPLK